MEGIFSTQLNTIKNPLKSSLRPHESYPSNINKSNCKTFIIIKKRKRKIKNAIFPINFILQALKMLFTKLESIPLSFEKGTETSEMKSISTSLLHRE